MGTSIYIAVNHRLHGLPHFLPILDRQHLAASPISHKPSHLLSRIDLAGVDVEPGRASGEGLRGNMLTARVSLRSWGYNMT